MVEVEVASQFVVLEVLPVDPEVFELHLGVQNAPHAEVGTHLEAFAFDAEVDQA